MTIDVTNIWNEFHKELRGFILNKTKSPIDTEDILQDVFLKITKNIDKVSQSKNLRQYLYGIVKNSIYDFFKKRKQIGTDIEVAEQLSENESEELNSTIAECCIRPFIEKLPPHYKEALLVTELGNIPQKELANKLNISYSGAKSRVQRGKEKLKALILDCCAYESDKYGNIINGDDKNCTCT